MSKKIIKILSIVLMTIFVCNIFCTVHAAGGAYKSAAAFDGTAPNSVLSVAKTFAENVIVILRIVGIALAMGILLIIAMKYMSAAPSEKADLKKYAINYVIAAVIIFGASNIIAVIYELSTAVKSN